MDTDHIIIMHVKVTMQEDVHLVQQNASLVYWYNVVNNVNKLESLGLTAYIPYDLIILLHDLMPRALCQQ